MGLDSELPSSGDIHLFNMYLLRHIIIKALSFASRWNSLLLCHLQGVGALI